jgi:peptide/nickel transport system substrate-binding protein
MTRREFTAVGGAGLVALASGRATLGAEPKTLRFIVRTDLRVLDPIWTTAYVSRNHGYMIFDTLFASIRSSNRSHSGRRLQYLAG